MPSIMMLTVSDTTHAKAECCPGRHDYATLSRDDPLPAGSPHRFPVRARRRRPLAPPTSTSVPAAVDVADAAHGLPVALTLPGPEAPPAAHAVSCLCVSE